MHNADQGPFAMPDDVEALARQYWSTWVKAMRGNADAATHEQQPWQQPLAWWTTLAKGGQHGADDALGRFNGQAQQWLSTMQQVAGQFAGRDAGATEIANAWHQALGGMGGAGAMPGFGGMPGAGMGSMGGVGGMPGMGGFGGGANPFAALMQGMQQGPGLHGFDHWMQQVAPLLSAMQNATESMPAQPSMPELPTFGFTRERDERWQRLARDQMDLRTRMQAYAALMMRATQDAFGIFESKLAEHEQPGRQLASARALFDLWIDAAEQAYAKIALSSEFRTVYGELVDAQMRVRAGVQREVEHACEQVGMPTRTELDGAHRKIVALERQVRRLRDGAAASTSRTTPRPGASAGVAETRVVSDSAAVVKPARSKAAVGKTARAKQPAMKTPKSTVKKSAKRAAAKTVKQSAKTSAKKAATKASKVRKTTSPRPMPATAATERVVVQTPANAAATTSAKRKPRKVKQPKSSSQSRARKGSNRKPSRKPAKASRAAAATAPVKRGPLPIFAHVSMPLAPAAANKKAR